VTREPKFWSLMTRTKVLLPDLSAESDEEHEFFVPVK